MMDWPGLLYSNDHATQNMGGTESHQIARSCSRCDVRWMGEPGCWVCSEPADGSPRFLFFG